MAFVLPPLQDRFSWRAVGLFLALLFCACGVNGQPAQTPLAPAAETDADAGTTAPEVVVPDGGFQSQMRVTVSHTRELRGLWVATVFNLDFPVASAASKASAEAYFDGLIDTAKRSKLNTLVFQVRPESDALYRSTKEPFSRFLVGTQGVDPGYDPLEVLLSKAHAAGLEVHAWLNPYRAAVDKNAARAPTHIAERLKQHAIVYGNAVVMDPSAKSVQDWVIEIVDDIVMRYDVDGIHFDDYFYPYPIDGQPFPDQPQFETYTAGGGLLKKSDWRRDNVNTLIKRVSETISGRKPWVRFGISPFGIYRPGQPVGVVGLDAYELLSCDAVKWMQQGWVDHLVPQLYWTSTSTGQPFGALVNWWGKLASNGRFVVAGHNASKLGTAPQWTPAELKTQVSLTRKSASGSLWFRAQTLSDQSAQLSEVFASVYDKPALPPPVATQRMAKVDAPVIEVTDAGVKVSPGSQERVRAFAVYRFDGARFHVEQIVDGSKEMLTLSGGQFAITAVSMADVESEGVVVKK